MNSIEINFYPALELVSAAASVSSPLKQQRDKTVPEDRLPEDIRSWRARVDSEMTPFERSDLDLVFSTVSSMIYLFYAVVRDGYRQPKELITALRALSDDDFVESFRTMLKIKSDVPNPMSASDIEQALELDRAEETIPFAEEAQRLASLLRAPGAFRVKLADILERFHDRFIVDNIENCERQVETRLKRIRPVLDTDPERLLDEISGGNYETLLSNRDRIVLLPIHYAGDEHSLLLPGEAYVVFGTVYLDHIMSTTMHPERVQHRTDEILKALSDPSRLAVMRLLRDRPRYGKEIADHLHVSAATASYHLEKLLAARLVRLDLSHGRRFYYTINPRRIRELQSCLTKEFLDHDATETDTDT